MGRTSLITAGFLLIFMGIQLNVVKSFTMTRSISNFLNENFSGDPGELNVASPIPSPQFDTKQQNYNSPYYQASYGNNTAQFQRPTPVGIGGRTIHPPHWICWPVLFFGAVLLLQGILRH